MRNVKFGILFLVVLLIGIEFHSINKTTLAPVAFEAKPTVWSQIVKKLDAIPNTFTLRSPVALLPQAHAAADYDSAASYIAIDESTGKILAEKNSNEMLSIASLTKIMTAVVALDLAKPTAMITISQKATTMPPTKIGVVAGEHMTLEELLHAMLMTSANDAAQAVADGIDAKYGSDVFIQAMNEKAKFLGLTNTHFANPQGFDDVHNTSTAHDLAILSTYALSHYPTIADIVKKDYVHLPANAQHKQFDLYNWNGLLGVYSGVSGMKIGNTNDAGYTTIVQSNREDHTILAVLLGAPGILERDLWTADLLDASFASSFGLPPVQVTTAALEAKYQTWQYWN